MFRKIEKLYKYYFLVFGTARISKSLPMYIINRRQKLVTLSVNHFVRESDVVMFFICFATFSKNPHYLFEIRRVLSPFVIVRPQILWKTFSKITTNPLFAFVIKFRNFKYYFPISFQRCKYSNQINGFDLNMI